MNTNNYAATQERENAWQRGFRQGWEDAKIDYFIRGCLAGGFFTSLTIFTLAYFLGA